MKHNKLLRMRLILGLIMVFAGISAKPNITNEMILFPSFQSPPEITQDSTFILFSLEDDTVFIGKKFPPEGAGIEDGTVIATETNIREHRAIRDKVRSVIDSDHYLELKSNKVWLILIIYIDQTGIMKEAQIRLDKRFEDLFSKEDLRNICLSVKGLKYTIQPQFRHLPYYRISQGVSFK